MLSSVALHARPAPLELIRADARRATATLAWGYRCVATLTGWLIWRKPDPLDGRQEWRMSARLHGPVDPFFMRQRPLLLTVPRKGGFWIWPVRQLTVLEGAISATLGPPEQ